MKKHLSTILILTTLSLTACGSASNGPQAGLDPTSGSLPTATQLLVGTMKLDGTEQDVTAEQAAELLPLWQVYNELLASDTAAQEELDGLVNQIQETMTEEQMQAISDMSLTQKDVFALMQEKGSGVIQPAQSSAGQTGSGSANPFGGGEMPMGAPPDGGAGMPGGMPSGSQTSSGNDSPSTEAGRGQVGGRVSSVLIETLIEMLESKGGS